MVTIGTLVALYILWKLRAVLLVGLAGLAYLAATLLQNYGLWVIAFTALVYLNH